MTFKTPSENIDLVILPPSNNDEFASDEEADNEELDEDYVPEEVAGNLEIHFDESSDGEASNDDRDNTRWRKQEKLSLLPHEIPEDPSGITVWRRYFQNFSAIF